MQSNLSLDQHTVIVINPARRFRQRLSTAWMATAPEAHGIQRLFLSTAASKWRRYLDHLEKRVNVAVGGNLLFVKSHV